MCAVAVAVADTPWVVCASSAPSWLCAPAMAELRAVVIKTGVVARLLKELAWYESETQDEAAKTERLRAAGACPHDVRQQVRCGEAAPTQTRE